MSLLEGSNDVQVWENAAFDSGGLERSADMKASMIELNRQCLSASFESDSSKENQNPLIGDSPAPFKTPVSNANTLLKPSKMTGSGKIGSKKSGLRDDAAIDLEIEQIEMEMRRLSLKLEALRLEKAERRLRIGERRGSIVPAKYMEPKQNPNPNLKFGSLKKNQDTKPQRRGVSLCPAEIYSASKSRQAISKPEVSNSSVKQGRRQSCFWKLGEIDELKVTKERGGIGKAASVSPKSRKPLPKLDAQKKAVTTIGSKKPIPKDVAALSSVQPKKLFNERSAPPKKPTKSSRVVASRYNQNTSVNSVAKLRSSSENEGKEEMKKRRESVGGSESRVKKRWEIPAEVVVYKSDGGESTPAVDERADVLPKIRTVRCVNETPRDSGAVKRVADLVGKKSFFSDEGDTQEVGVRQALSFVDEEEADDAQN